VARSVERRDTSVREHLLAFYHGLRSTYADNARRDGDEELARAVDNAWGPMVNALLDGKAVRLTRSDLPDDHPLRRGAADDLLELGSDDVIRPIDEPTDHRFVPPNRAERRALRKSLDRYERAAQEREAREQRR
jgi:hypothetical protein